MVIATDVDLAATLGDLNMLTSGGPNATLTATNFSFLGSGAVDLSGGSITVTGSGSISVPGLCNFCDINLIGPFTVSAYVPPPINFAQLTTANITTLTELVLTDGYSLWYEIAADGSLVLTNRRLNQCY